MIESRLDDFVVHDDSQSFVEKFVTAFVSWLVFFGRWVFSNKLFFHGDFVPDDFMGLWFRHGSDHAWVVARPGLEHVGGLGNEFFERGILAHVHHVEHHLLEIEGRVLAVSFAGDDSKQYFVDSLDLHDKRKLARQLDTLVPCENQQRVYVVWIGFYADRF